jgi:hypothetical protein
VIGAGEVRSAGLAVEKVRIEQRARPIYSDQLREDVGGGIGGGVQL